MSSTPLCASQGNSYCRQAPTITLTAAHRESLAKPAHTPILHQATRTMFSTKPAQHPAGPRRWFRKLDPPLQTQYPTPKTAPVPIYPPPTLPGQAPLPAFAYVPQPSPIQQPTANKLAPQRPSSLQPRSPQDAAQSRGPASQQMSPQPRLQLSGQTSPQSQSPRPIGHPRTRGPDSFDGWMAQFCVEPAKDTDGCCLAFWAPCTQYGKTHWRLKQIEGGRDGSDATWSPNFGCNGPCWAWFGFCCLSCDCILTGVQRARIRATYGIEGSRTEDFALAIFCRPCTMVQMDREVRAREGDRYFRTNPKAPVIDDQPSRIQEMRYVSPRATNSNDSQNRIQNGRDCSAGACDRADPVASSAGPKKVPKQQPNPAKPKSNRLKLDDTKSGDLKSEKSAKSPHSELVYVEMSQLEDRLPSPLKPTKLKTSGANSYSFSLDALLQRPNKEAQDGKKASARSSDPTSRRSHNENKKDVRSSSTTTHGLHHFPPGVLSKELHSKQGAELKKETDSTPGDTRKGEAKEVQSQLHIVAVATNRERETSEQTAIGSDSVIVASFKARDWKNDATSTTDAHELSYVHDFSDCPVDKNVLDYYEKEEQRSQASQQHTMEDCSRTSPSSAHHSKSPEQHVLEDCPEKDRDQTMKSKSTSPQPHALANCPEKDTSSKTKSDGTQTHKLDDDPIEKGDEGRSTALEAHALADCPEKIAATTKVKSPGSQRHTLVDCPEKDTSDKKSAHSQPHALVDCSKGVKSSGLQLHALADCILESASNSPTEQHTLAECHDDVSRQSRRASSNPDSHTDRHPQAKEHRLASCPASSPNLEEEKAKTAHHAAENARINESGDSQSTVKPSGQHTLSDCMGGVKLERQTAAVDNQPRAERHASLSSLRDFIKRKQDLADHPQKSRYRKEIDSPNNSSGTKRPSHAQQSLSQILGGSGPRKEKSRDDSVEAIKGAMHSVGDKLKKRSDSIGDAFKRQTDKIGGDAKKGTETIGGEVKKGTENVGDEGRKQTGNIRGKEEHKSSGSGFSNILSRMSPKSKAQQ